MQVTARLRNLRMSPRKVRLVIDLIRGLSIDAALQQLTFNSKAASLPVMKLLKSAIANAEHNHQADISTLRIAKITADAGTTLHRFQPRAHGSAAPIRKRSSHITIILSDETPAVIHAAQARKGKKASSKEAVVPEAKGKKTTSKPASKARNPKNAK
jgi:large subunit ribosomal protein L22